MDCLVREAVVTMTNTDIHAMLRRTNVVQRVEQTCFLCKYVIEAGNYIGASPMAGPRGPSQQGVYGLGYFHQTLCAPAMIEAVQDSEDSL